MLRRLRTSSLARAAAALLLLPLAGVPRLVLALGDRGEHRCTCPARGTDHRCECPICRKAAEAARAREEENLPPCHRAARRSASPAPPEGSPCARSACGVLEGPRALATGLEPFAPPERESIATFPPAPVIDASLREIADVVRGPEPPRPRA